MSNRGHWLMDIGGPQRGPAVDGLVFVAGFRAKGLPPEQYVIMEKAETYSAQCVFFSVGRGGIPVPEAFIYISDGPEKDHTFGELHRQLWSWGGVPLIYRCIPGLVQLFRCAHKADFESKDGTTICRPFATLKQTAAIDSAIKKAAWWDSEQLRNGTLWDDPQACKNLLRNDKAAHKTLINEIKSLSEHLNQKALLPKHLQRKLLILSLLIAYLEARKVLTSEDFRKHLDGADQFFKVLAKGPALVSLLDALESRFNGNVFSLSKEDREHLLNNSQLVQFAQLIESRQEKDGQLTLWNRYSFRDLPVELISHVYQLFVKDANSSVYTPPFLVRLMLDEAMSWKRLDWLEQQEAVVLDPSCGSGVFLVESYKRLVTHWRLRNGWKKPGVVVLKNLLTKVHGIDLEPGAVELAAFSLCLALCDALDPEEIRQSVKLFPPLMGKSLQASCFFEAKEKGKLKASTGIIVGNPPFDSRLTTEGAKSAYKRYLKNHGELPDKQLAYLFLHEAMETVISGGILSLLQQYNFLYNQLSVGFRRRFIERWDVREILDFISVRGLFQKGGADTKIVVVVAEANPPPPERQILHATFRRSVRADAEQGFDIDYYDLFWLPRSLVLNNDGVWRSNLLGGGRVLGLVDRLKKMRTLGAFVDSKKAQGKVWDVGEGFIVTKSAKAKPAPHLTGKFLIEPKHLERDAPLKGLTRISATHIRWQYSETRFQAPMTLIHQNEELATRFIPSGYFGYKHKIVGVCGPPADSIELQQIAEWIRKQQSLLTCFVCAAGTTTFTQRSTWVGLHDILHLPYPESSVLDISVNEQILVDDIVNQLRSLVREGQKSSATTTSADSALGHFNETFLSQINSIYCRKPLRALPEQIWPGVICQPYIFGKGRVDWSGADELKDKLDGLLKEQRGASLHVTRIARIYDGNIVYLLKPNRLRYWLRSVALRDADETLSDLADQGF